MKNIIAKLNKSFDNKVRLGVMSVLLVDDWVEFTRLREMLELTDGRLASHLKVLESEGFIKLKKNFVNRKPKTTYQATSKGRKAFNDHLNALEELIKSIE